MKTYHSVDYRSVPLFKDVAAEDWNNWRWQMANAIRDVKTLAQVIHLDTAEKDHLDQTLERFRMSITPYYASLMHKQDKLCSVRLQAVPRIREMHDEDEDLDDPLHEDIDSTVSGLTHRYPDRVLFLVTNICSMYCRHCTRRRFVGHQDDHLPSEHLEQGYAYIRKHKQVRDVVLSGGDPLTLGEDQLEPILKALREIEHVEIIRIGTRTPVVCPQRITDDFVRMVRKYHPVYINTHFNHYKEVTLEAQEACARLADGGIPVANQSVLLRDVNDCPRIMKRLVHELLMIRVRPYYIYQCDMSRGISHFRTSIAKGMEIMENLRGHTSGLAVPTFVVDAPGGAGKIPVGPKYILSESDKRVILRNYEGVITTYTQPENITSDCWCELCKTGTYGPLDGVAKLLLGERLALEPQGLKRILRHDEEP